MSSAISTSHEPQPVSSLARLPAEIVSGVTSCLSNRDIKSLRSTCRVLCAKVNLRLNRVFLSANPRNVDVFRAIADHAVFRKHVSEIIWDDAVLDWFLGEEELWWFDIDWEKDIPEGCPRWYALAYYLNIGCPKWSKLDVVDRPDLVARAKQMPLHLCWEYYQQLLQQQNDVLESEAHIKALRYGLQRFPSLKRITITPAAHGFLFAPLYQTPMIRSFPYDFNYPIPRGWPTIGMDWSELYGIYPHAWDNDRLKRERGGFSIVTRELTRKGAPDHHVSELVLDVNDNYSGLNCSLFDQPCEEYNNLVELLRRPGFRRIDLALFAHAQRWDEWSSFRSGYLKQALAEAKDLQHLSLQTMIDPEEFKEATWAWADAFREDFTPLSTNFPVDKLQSLRHFGLSQFLVRQDDLVSLLAALPETLRSVELSYLLFLADGGNQYMELLTKIRDTLGWRERNKNERPRLRIHVRMEGRMCGAFAFLCVDKEVDRYLYGDGTNPFSNEPIQIHDSTRLIRNSLDRNDHDRPNAVDFQTIPIPVMQMSMNYSVRGTTVMRSRSSSTTEVKVMQGSWGWCMSRNCIYQPDH